MLRADEGAHVFRVHPEVLAGARTHAQLRQQQGIDVAAAVRELGLLRAELWTIFRRTLPLN